MLTTRYILDEAHLKHYDERLKSWASSQPVKTIPSSLYPWTQTDKAGAVTCWPVGGTPLKPVVDFLFTEVPPASGDKGPDNPSTITGVSEVNLWLAGKNINRVVPYYGFTDGVKVVNDVTFTANADGSVTVNGLADGNANCTLYNSNNTSIYGDPIGVGVWTVSGCPSGSNNTYALQTVISTGYGSSSGYEFGSGSTATITKPGARIGLIIRIPSGYNAQNLVFKPQIELGNEKTSYEQSVEKQKYTINLGSTYYGGSIDLSTGLMTVTQFFYSFAGGEMTESSNKGDGWRQFVYKPNGIFPFDGAVSSDKACTHFPFIQSASQQSLHWYVQSAGNICMFSNQFANIDEFNAWLAAQALAGTPVQVTYKIATPTTVQLTPTEILSLAQQDKYTPRLNTVYTDASSVQVGYVKSPIRDEYELQQAVIAQGGEI